MTDSNMLRAIQTAEKLHRTLSLREHAAPMLASLATEPHSSIPSATVFGAPELWVIDALENVPLVAAAGTPWPVRVSIRAGLDASLMTERAELAERAQMGLVRSGIAARPIGRWDRVSMLEVYMPGAALSSEPETSVLAGANRLLVETGSGWELIAFRTAELIEEDTYGLSGLLRGLRGTTPGHISMDARCVILDSAVQAAAITDEEIGVALDWQVAVDTFIGPVQRETFEARGALAYRPGHLRARWQGAQLLIRWTRRGKDVPESWALPEASNAGRFQIEVLSDTSSLGVWTSDVAEIQLTPLAGAKWVKVCEIGPHGRPGAAEVLLIPGALA